MSKNTKIIAIVGAVLIVILVLYSAFTKGGCSGAIDAWKGVLGCQTKKKATKKKGHSRDFCVQHPNDKACQAKTSQKGGDEGDEEEARPARPAAGGAVARPAGTPARPAARGGMAADDD